MISQLHTQHIKKKTP